jgi:hypothetical protein
VRILIVAPNLEGVDAIPEVRRIQTWHDCSILYGTVTVDDVFRACQEKTYDVIHFASHGGPVGVQLSNGIILTSEDIAQAVRLRETKGVFLNACNTGRIASYVVRHGAIWAISSEINLPDEQAWKLAAAYYGHQRNGHGMDFIGAYILADSGDGEYSLMISPEYVRDLQRTSNMSAAAPHNALPLTQAELIKWGLFFLAASVALSTLLARLAGG